MHVFKDDTSREWSLKITAGAMRRVLTAFPDVDLLQIDVAPAPASPDADPKPTLAARLTTDPLLTCQVIYRLVKPEADQGHPPLSEDDFLERLGGPSMKNALAAFWEEMRDFFLSLDRRDLAQIAELQRKLLQEIVEHNAAAIAAWEKTRASPGNPNLPAAGSTSTGLPESAESTPTLSP